MPLRLQVRNLHKAFATAVLKGVSIELQAGEIHALVGENGAGKSTIMNILSGLLPQDQGEILINGVNYNPTKPKDAFHTGVSFAAQELSLLPTLSVAENIGLRKLPCKSAAIDRQELDSQALKRLKKVGLGHIDPATPTEQLNLSEQQLVEIAKAISLHRPEPGNEPDCNLLILDEPTAALTGPQADRLHQIIREIAHQGTSVIYISHRLEDVLEISDRVSILRDGEVVLTKSAGELSIKSMISYMSGRDGLDHVAERSGTPGEVSVDICAACTRSIPNPVKLQVRQGEILGIAGLAGSGRTELLNAIYAMDPLTSGHIYCRDPRGVMTEIRSPGQAVKSAIGYLPEERKTQGILAGLPITANISLPAVGKIASSMGLINFKAERQAADDLIQELAIKCDGAEQAIERLSGGNQQKGLLGRWIFAETNIFLLDEPTRGIDVAAKDLIYQKLHQLREQGKTFIVASSELDELTAICDHIAVMSNRRMVRLFSNREWSHTAILEAAFSEYNEQKESVTL